MPYFLGLFFGGKKHPHVHLWGRHPAANSSTSPYHGWAWCCFSRKLFRLMPVRYPAVGASGCFVSVWVSFSSQKSQPAVKKGMYRADAACQKAKKTCSELMQPVTKGPSLLRARLSTSVGRLVVSCPCGGRSWSWTIFSQLCRCTTLRCSTGPLLG